LFARHNVLVFPSLVPETFGISQVEAMAAGLLVISSATGGAREVILDGQTGLYFKAGDYSRLAFLLMEMLRDRSQWERLAQAGEQYALSHFNIESSVDQFEEVFRQALEDPKSGV
jgi:glycosyltransferase involved in cell wall biosynthesis